MDIITVHIGDGALPLDQADPNWITEQLNRRRKAGQSVCVRVKIEVHPDINMLLSTLNCQKGNGVTRGLRRKEQMIFELWERHNLNNSEIHPGDLVSFLRQLDKLIG